MHLRVDDGGTKSCEIHIKYPFNQKPLRTKLKRKNKKQPFYDLQMFWSTNRKADFPIMHNYVGDLNMIL